MRRCDGCCVPASLLVRGSANFTHIVRVGTDCTELHVFRRIAEGLESSLPNLETLVLTGNLIQELADLDPLASIKSLRTLSLLHNPVTTRQHYRLYVAFKLPQVRLLDFRKIKVKVSAFCLQEQMCDDEPLYRVSQEERTKLREGVPYVKLYRYNPKHLCPKLNGFRDNGK